MDNKDNIFLNTSLELVRINVDDLKIGMYVSELDRPWVETPFRFQGFELKTEKEIKALQTHCEFVYIDTLKTRARVEKRATVKNSSTKSWVQNKKPSPRRLSFQEEYKNAGEIHQQTSFLIKTFMKEVRLADKIDVQATKEAVSKCVDSVMNSPDALLWMTQLKDKSEYLSQHSMNVCILAIALGRFIGLDEKELHKLGLCGMLHDIGKLKLPDVILNKPGPLTAKDVQLLKSHTTLGWQLLSKQEGMYEGAIEVAYSHHEKLDGSGYPRGLTAEKITLYTRIVAIADIYDAITSNKPYRKGRTHLEAINHLTKIGESHLDLNLTVRFIECLGIYPPGSLVEMQNGEVAIVIEINPQNKIKPKVIFVLDENKRPQKERLEDLAYGAHHRIKGMVKAEDFDIDINAFYRDNLLDKSFAHV